MTGHVSTLFHAWLSATESSLKNTHTHTQTQRRHIISGFFPFNFWLKQSTCLCDDIDSRLNQKENAMFRVFSTRIRIGTRPTAIGHVERADLRFKVSTSDEDEILSQWNIRFEMFHPVDLVPSAPPPLSSLPSPSFHRTEKKTGKIKKEKGFLSVANYKRVFSSFFVCLFNFASLSFLFWLFSKIGSLVLVVVSR